MKDGGPAFPRPEGWNGLSCEEHSSNAPQAGMSLRDYFAAAALTGIMAYGGVIESERAAEKAFKCADAMLAERKP